MKDTVKCSRALGQLEKMFRELNHDKFDDELETPIITVQSTPRAFGHVTCGKVWKRSDEKECLELNIGAGTLNRPIENVCSTLLHEMVHIYNMQHNIQDTSRGNTYHNKKFKVKAEEVGLNVEHDQKIGWSVTFPSDDLILYIADKGWEDIKIGREEGFSFPAFGVGKAGDSGKIPTDITKVKKPSSTRKLQCPCCKNSVRATKDVYIICGDCGERMITV
jgi:hypothetical protein